MCNFYGIKYCIEIFMLMIPILLYIVYEIRRLAIMQETREKNSVYEEIIPCYFHIILCYDRYPERYYSHTTFFIFVSELVSVSFLFQI